MNNEHNHPNQLQRDIIMNLREQGFTFQYIADRLSISKQRVHTLWTNELGNTTSNTTTATDVVTL